MFCVISTRLVAFVTRCKGKRRTPKLYLMDKINPQLDFVTQQWCGGLWGARGEYRTLLRAGPWRGMMGSNNHIITSSVWAMSDVRGIKEACRVHKQAAKPCLCRSPSHLFMRMCKDRNVRHVKRDHTFYYGMHANTRSRIQKAGCSSCRKAQGCWGFGSEVTGCTKEVLTPIKEREVN